MNIAFRSIQSAAELDSVARLRYAVYVDELGKYPSAANHETRTVLDDLDQCSEVLAAFDGERPVATVRITSASRLPSDSHWRGFYELGKFSGYSDGQFSITSRLMVAPELRGTLVAAQLLCLTYDVGRSMGTLFNFMHCAPGLVSLYEQMGFRRYCGGKIDPEIGFRIPMTLVSDDVEYLKSVRSPFFPQASRKPSNSINGHWFRETFKEYSEHSSVKMLGSKRFFEKFSKEIFGNKPELLDGLSAEEVEVLFKSGVVHNLDPGQDLIRHGDKARDLFLVVRGAVEIFAFPRTSGNPVAVLTEGQFIGEGSFLSNLPRQADVRAVGACSVISISHESFEKLSVVRPEIALKTVTNIAKAVCGRLYKLNNHLG